MQSFFKRILQLFNQKQAKGFLTIFAGNTISKIVLTIGGFILANLYGASSFGVYNVFLSYLAILSIAGSLRLDELIILEQNKYNVQNIFNTVLRFPALTISFFIFLILSFRILVLNSNFDSIDFSISLAGIGAMCTAWNKSFENYAIKSQIYNSISISLIAGGLVTFISQGLFFYLNIDEFGLIYGWLIGGIISLLILFSRFYSHIQPVNWKNSFQIIKKNPELLKYSFVSDIINALGNNIIPILTIAYFTSEQTGVFSMASKLLATPLLLLSASFSKLYMKESAELIGNNKRELYLLTKKSIITIGLIMLAYIVILNVSFKFGAAKFFDNSYQDLASYILILSFWIMARSLVNPISPVILVLKLNHYSLYFNLTLLITSLISIYFGIVHKNYIVTISIFSIISGIGYLILLFAILKKLHYESKQASNLER